MSPTINGVARPRMKTTLRRLAAMKAADQRIIALGVYDAVTACIADAIGFELFVIGNSGPMCLLGRMRATEVPESELIAMTAAVSRTKPKALVVGTLAFGSSVSSRRDAVRAAVRMIVQGGADAVQVHGNRATARFIRAITDAGIPVLAHLGLQSVRQIQQSGFGVKGRDPAEALSILDDAWAMVEAGAFALIVEAVPTQLCGHLRGTLPIPVLSLGSGGDADGIYLVAGDATGYSVFPKPSNAGRFVDAVPVMEAGLATYVAQVRAQTYPEPDQTRAMKPGEFERFLTL